jgi:hypothetical protein
MAGRERTGGRTWALLALSTGPVPAPIHRVRDRSNGQGSPEVVGSRHPPTWKPLTLLLFRRRRSASIFLRVAFSTLLRIFFRVSYEISRGSLTRSYQKSIEVGAGNGKTNCSGLLLFFEKRNCSTVHGLEPITKTSAGSLDLLARKLTNPAAHETQTPRNFENARIGEC